MARTYTLKRRADQQAETRLKIVEAAVDLHSEIGPAQTTVSQIAERAGVQRHTVYAHFPDERSLFMACSGLAAERDPLPDAETLRAIPDPKERLRLGLSELYSWYERNVGLAGCVLRDSEYHPLTREIAYLRVGQRIEGLADAMGGAAPAGAARRAAIKLALSFFTWRELTREGGLTLAEAVALMTRSVECASA